MVIMEKMSAMANLSVIIIIFIVLSGCASKKNITGIEKKVQNEQSREKRDYNFEYLLIEAARQKVTGNYSNALKLYYRAIEMNDSSAAALFEISKINQQIQNYSLALNYGIKAFELNTKNKWYGYNLANLYIANRKYSEAILVYEKLMKYHSNADLKYNLALLKKQVKDYDDAIDLLHEIEEETGVNEITSIGKQQIYQLTGEIGKAVKELEKLLTVQPDETRYMTMLAELYMQIDSLELAKQKLERVFEIDSNNEYARLTIIDFYIRNNEYEKVVPAIKNVIDNNTIQYQRKVVTLATIMSNENLFNQIKEPLEKVLIQFQHDYKERFQSYTLYADYLIREERYVEAADKMQYVIDNEAFNEIFWERYISLLSIAADFEKMYKYSEMALDSTRLNPLFYLMNGVAAIQIEKYREAVEVLKKGTKRVENDEELLLEFYGYMGEAFHKLEEYAKSDNYFEKVLEKQPDNIMIMNNYSYYLSLRKENLEKAETLSRKTIETDPDNNTYLDTYAWILFQKGDFERALKFIEKSLENGGHNSLEILEHAGDIYYKNGEVEKAVEYWKKAKEKGKDDPTLEEKIKSGKIVHE